MPVQKHQFCISWQQRPNRPGTPPPDPPDEALLPGEAPSARASIAAKREGRPTATRRRAARSSPRIPASDPRRRKTDKIGRTPT